jgi:hypothetical protein
MGLRNYWRFAHGSNATHLPKALGLALAVKIPDDNRDKAEFTTIQTLARIVGWGDTQTRAALKKLERMGELKRTHTSGTDYDGFRIVWEALNPPSDKESEAEHKDYRARRTPGAPVCTESDSDCTDSDAVPCVPGTSGNSGTSARARRTSEPLKALKPLKGAPTAPPPVAACASVAPSGGESEELTATAKPRTITETRERLRQHHPRLAELRQSQGKDLTL